MIKLNENIIDNVQIETSFFTIYLLYSLDRILELRAKNIIYKQTDRV